MAVRKEDGHLDYKAMIAKTQDAIERGVKVICEAAFSYEGNYCAVDILRKVKGTNLVSIDNSYVRHGELELDKLFDEELKK